MLGSSDLVQFLSLATHLKVELGLVWEVAKGTGKALLEMAGEVGWLVEIVVQLLLYSMEAEFIEQDLLLLLLLLGGRVYALLVVHSNSVVGVLPRFKVRHPHLIQAVS